MKTYLRTCSITVALLLAVGVYAEETYVIDTSHAHMDFAVSHLVISKVKGGFRDFQGKLVLDAAGKLVSAEATIQVRSIDTGIEKRDEHLRNPDFFDVEKFPVITFKSTKVLQKDGKNILIGQFTIRDVTKELALPFAIQGPITDPWGNKKIGFATEVTINRTDYGLTWNKTLENGGFVIGEEVAIDVNFEAARQ